MTPPTSIGSARHFAGAGMRFTSTIAWMRSTPSAATTRSRPYTPPPGLHLHPLKSRSGILSPLATQATGLPLFKTAELREALDDPETDVVHFHNISLVGGPGVLGLGTNRRAVRIMTAHEHWLICPMHLLWKYDREPCDAPSCVSCCLKGGRPPQVWRLSSAIERGLRNLDALVFPSRHALEEHRRRGIGAHVPLVHVPYFLPDGWSGGIEGQPPEALDRPYLAAAGRLVKMKGFQRLIPLMRYLPEVDLRIAGTGPYEPALRAMAADLPNVRFEGLAGRAGAGSSFSQRPRGRGAVALPRNVRLRGARGVLGGNAGRRPRGGRRPLRDRVLEWRRAGLPDRQRAVDLPAQDGPRPCAP